MHFYEIFDNVYRCWGFATKHFWFKDNVEAFGVYKWDFEIFLKKLKVFLVFLVKKTSKPHKVQEVIKIWTRKLTKLLRKPYNLAMKFEMFDSKRVKLF